MITNEKTKEVTVFCRKSGEGHVQYQRPGQIVDGIFKPGAVFSIRPFESKKLPEDVADAMRRDFPAYILTDEEARAEQLRADQALKAKDEQIADLQAQLDDIRNLTARAAKGDKRAMADLTKILSEAKVVEDGKPVTKIMPAPQPAQAEEEANKDTIDS
jgi:hypothetical protein